MKIRLILAFLILIGTGIAAAIGSNPSYHNELQVGRGYGSTGIDMEKDGDILTDGKITIGASTTTRASGNVPHGTAPSSPINGDYWTETTGWYVRINGTTYVLLSEGTTGASPTFTGMTLSGLTQGQVVFPGSGGVLSGENNLFWNSANDRFGVRTSNPQTVVEFKNTSIFTAASLVNDQHNLFLNNTTDTAGDEAFGGSIGFGPAVSSDRAHASIVCIQTYADPHVNGLAFYTHPSSSYGANLVEAMRIEGNGNFGVGKNDPAYQIDSAGDINTDGIYRVSSTQISSDDLSDTASIGMLNENETITANWVNTLSPWADNEVSNTLTASIFKGPGSVSDVVDLQTSEVAGVLTDANVNNNITLDGDGSKIIKGMLSTVTNDTNGKTLTIAESMTIQTNSGAGGGAVWNLPEASTAIGVRYTFVVVSAQNFDINPEASDLIRVLTNSAGDAVRSATLYDTITLVAVNNSSWVVISSEGTWTDVN